MTETSCRVTRRDVAFTFVFSSFRLQIVLERGLAEPRRLSTFKSGRFWVCFQSEQACRWQWGRGSCCKDFHGCYKICFFVWRKKKELVPPGVNSLQHPWIQPDNSCHLLSIRKLQMSSSCLDGVSKTDYSSAAKRKCWRVRFCEQLICSHLYEVHAESDVSDGMSRQSSHVCGDRHSMFWDLRVFSAVSVAKLSQNMIFS